MSSSRLSFKRATLSLILISLIYVFVLVIIDFKKNIFNELLTLSSILPIAMAIAFASYLFRFFRWHWLLSRIGHSLPPGISFLSYLSGFSLTASPGKIGELLRIRYFSRLGVRHQDVISVFVFERAFDLITVLAISMLAAIQLGAFTLITTFVLLAITTVILFARHPSWLGYIAIRLRALRFRKLSKLVKTLRDGLHGIHQWANLPDISISFILGLIAWLSASYAFVWLISNLNVELPFLSAIAIYPIAMLIGAASMLPGGVGSTEAAIVVLLAMLGTPVTIATVAAIGIRIASLWFSIICGLISMLILEYLNARHPYQK